MINKKPTRKPYLKNQDLYDELKKYRDSGKERIPDSLTRMIMLIPQRLITKPCYSGYMFAEDMVNDAIFDCIRVVHRYDLTRLLPFAYFTTISLKAFHRRIFSEKRYLYTKLKALENTQIFDELYSDQDGDRFEVSDGYNDESRSKMMETMHKLEKEIVKPKAK